ncbi:hypothetical protein GCM10018785_16530 [Streptomyces longispororuber]|uniref:Bacterial repeat domain-containing protein n=1 Tax=Streptomyces longispororuber TaxID=68230 RepID=A0A919DHA0_9ACTN|nr:hypothetical protein [Streptomyces longispororuber]GHE47657.1 hypothetical protein GCM10018785_16530 [Streptomyces longispororuber]
MSTVVCGTHTLTIDTALGARIARARLRTTATDPLGPARTRGLPQPFLMGRDAAVRLAHTAVENREAVNFHAPCGYGKTTLLRHLVALGTARGATEPHVYLKLGDFGLDDLLQRLVSELYTLRPAEASEEPVRLTTQQCAQILGHANALVALDDVTLTESQLAYVRRMLPGCALVIGSGEPVLGEGGAVHDLGGLVRAAGVSLLARELGRVIRPEEAQAAHDLVGAVQGQPLHIRQVAALVTSGEHTLASLAAVAERDPGELDRLSIDALTADERRVLAVCAFAAGALIPATLVAAMADVAYVTTALDALFRKGLVEHPDDRFGLPVCKGETYRGLLLGYFALATAERGLVEWFRERPAVGEEAHTALESAVGLLGYAAGVREWQAVIDIVRAVEPVLFVQGRWETWQRVVACGLEAARARQDALAEAYFAHQRGTLLFFQDRAEEAGQELEKALDIRDRLADEEGAERTRENLAFVVAGPNGTAPPRRRPPRDWRRIRRAAVVAGAGLAAVVAGGFALDALGLNGSDDQGRDKPPGVSGGTSAGPSGGSGNGGNGGNSGNGGNGTEPKQGGGDGGGGGNGGSGVSPGGPGGGGGTGDPGAQGEQGEQGKKGKQGEQGKGGRDGRKGERGGPGGTDGEKPATPVVTPGSAVFRDALVRPGAGGGAAGLGVGAQEGRPETRTFTVVNPGSKVSTVDTVELTGSDAFQVVTDDCSSVELGPGRQTSCSVTVAFRPGGVGEVTARLTAGWGGSTSFAEVSGTGYARVLVGVEQMAGGQGSVVVSGSGNCTGSACSYDVKDPDFSLTAVAGDQSQFQGWKGACQGVDPQCTPPLTGVQKVVGVFKPITTSSSPPPSGEAAARRGPVRGAEHALPGTWGTTAP